MPGAKRIVSPSEMRVVGRSTECRFVHVQLAQNDGARRTQSLHDFGILGRDAVRLAAEPVAGGHARHVDVVLERDWYAVETAETAPRARTLGGGARFGSRNLRTQRNVTIERAADAFRPTEKQFRQGFGVNRPRLQEIG